jgi:hypothetical protein
MNLSRNSIVPKYAIVVPWRPAPSPAVTPAQTQQQSQLANQQYVFYFFSCVQEHHLRVENGCAKYSIHPTSEYR